MTTSQEATRPGTLAVGEATEDWTGDARFFEYSQAADPIGDGVITPVPAVTFSPDLYAGGPSRVVPLDASAPLGTSYPATSLAPIQDAGLQTYLRDLDIRFSDSG